ncbi:hypothetical protein BY458DRAFT_490142 [Sporodiniella umbellata]|nr:hypothetical protein BY458DRAFT_490142 [Sporodiniella umbellata]
MSNEERLSTLLAQAQQLVGQKLEPKEGSIQDALISRLEELELKPINDLAPKASFAKCCLRLLVHIQAELLALCANSRGEIEKDFLGVRDLRLVHTLLEIVISWGLYSFFLPGVGVPLSKRVKSGYTNQELFTAEDENDQKRISIQALNELYELVTPLVDMIANSAKTTHAQHYTTIASILMTRHLPDIYAALLELAYVPATEVMPNQDMIPISPGQFISRQGGLEREKRDKCARMFMWLFDRSDIQKAMESLMSLLSNSPLHPVPNWLRNICGKFLSRTLLQPKGVALVLEFTVGQVDQLQLTQLENISKLILSVPQKMSSVDDYYAVICPQLLALLERDSTSPATHQAVTFIIGRIVAQDANHGKKYIVDPIVGTLTSAWNQSEYEEQEDLIDRVVLSEDALTGLLHTVHKLMIGGEPSAKIIQTCLSSIVPCLYHLYEFTVQSKSGLRETALDLLLTYFRITTTADGIRELKRMLLDKVDLRGDRIAYFAPGPTAQVELRFKRIRRPLAGNQLPLNADVFVDFMGKMNNNNLCGDLFVFLLNEYSSLQKSKDDPKTILLTIHLIMGMLDKMGTSILAKPTQVISFAMNGVQDYVDKLAPKEKKKESSFPDFTRIVTEEDRDAIEDDSSFEEELESLILAINLLRAVMHENEELDEKSVQLLTACLEPLTKLEKLPIELIQDPVQELLLAITSYLSAQKMSKKKKNQPSLEASREKYKEAMKSLQDDLLPIRAHGMGMLKEMVLSKDPLFSSREELSQVLDVFIRLVQDEDSYIYLNAVKGLSAMTDAYGNDIIQKLGAIYSDNERKLDNRLRIGEALLQTVQRCGDALGKYIYTLLAPLEAVLSRRNEDSHLRVSALSILGVACETCPVALHSQMSELIDWVLNILDFEKSAEVRRAGTVLILSLFRGLAQQTLYSYPAENLRRTYRTLRYIEELDPDELTRYQAQVALSDLDTIMRNEIFKQKKVQLG